jgi:amidase
VLCEDTRHTRLLLVRHGITARLLSYHAHNEAERTAEVLARLERGDRIRSGLLRWFERADLIVCPAMPQPAIRHGESNADWFGDTYSDVHNLTGWPAAVVRAGTSDEGLPIGVQLIAHPWREDVALAAAKVVEAATGGWLPPPI